MDKARFNELKGKLKDKSFYTKKEVTIMQRPSKIQACRNAWALISSYERIKFTTLYRQCFWDNAFQNWRYIGKAHNYTL